ncbi:protein ELYS isoform X2 [Daktulosphaira vitifoliae]|uniref:protein ELYS isoform X2 n=1 Tax=Daktulosphaira vitifoliae TaxID=58002 RepID=UPI0021AAC2DC|nr:protein ELYS isoform X2 [Daktulosphaira vitifoliae]
MSSLKQVMQVINSHQLPAQLIESNKSKLTGLINNGLYAWFAFEANIILYSKQLESIVSSRIFGDNFKDKSLRITYVNELNHDAEKMHFLLVGCSFKSSGLLYVCQLPTLTTVRCIELPNPVTYISSIKNESFDDHRLCDEFKMMSTILLVGMSTGAVYAIDLRYSHIKQKLNHNEIVINESRPSKLFIIGRNEDCQEVKEMSDDSDCHLAMFINENFYAYCKKQYNGKLNLSVSSLLFVEEINTVAIGYSTGHFQLRDCKSMRTIYLLKEPKCSMPVSHIGFLEPSDDPNNLCYLWVIQSDNTRLPHATMIALTYEHRNIMPNGNFAYSVYQGNGVKLEMSLKRETGIGKCISVSSVCNVNMARDETDMDEDCEIRLFAMLLEIRQSVDSFPESCMFLFDINQWYKAQMPSNISHLKISNSYASFVKLPNNVNYLDFNISTKTLRPFGSNFRSNVEELYYPSSIYFECDCLLDTELVRLKHTGVQQKILDQLFEKNWRMLINPNLVFNQCLEVNLKPFFWDKSDDYNCYSMPDQRSFVVSILVENKMMSVLNSCAEEWKNGTYASSEATILHLVQSLWKHVMVVKQFADKLCVPLFDYSGTQLDKKSQRMLNHCLSQMQCVKIFLEDLHNTYGAHITNVDYSYRVSTLSLVTQYFKAVTCFLNYGLLPESLDINVDHPTVHCAFQSLINYSNQRRTELGDSQLYLIDAVVNHEKKGFKLIEQWQHEGGEATKGMYPPANVQCLLRIYLNAALSDQVKNYITIYFLIDVCSTQDLDETTANRMCNFAIEFDVENKILNSLCRASWLLDHDMFEDAMEILSSDKDWAKKTKNKSWEWFHWTVMKLLVFKKEYFWAQFYMKLISVNIKNEDDHKFYINLLIMNNQIFDALHYIQTKHPEEKLFLLEYFFNRCKEVNKLRSLINYQWELEEDVFLNYLKTLKDPESLSIQLLFLLQRGRYTEAVELNNSFEKNSKIKYDDDLMITSLLVHGFNKTLPKINSQIHGNLTVKNVYKKTDTVLKSINSDGKSFNIIDKIKENTIKLWNSPNKFSKHSNEEIVDSVKNSRKRSPKDDDIEINKEKRRKIQDCILSPPNTKITEVCSIGKQVLEILNTPLVGKSIASPPVVGYSSILKTAGSSKKHKNVLSIIGNNTPISKTTLRFSLPNEENSYSKKCSSIGVDLMNDDNQGNESFYSVSSNDVSEQTTNISEQKSIISKLLSNDTVDYEVDKKDYMSDEEILHDEYEKMDTTENSFYHKEVQNDSIPQNIETHKSELKSKVIELVELSSDEEEINEIYNNGLKKSMVYDTMQVDTTENKSIDNHSLQNYNVETFDVEKFNLTTNSQTNNLSLQVDKSSCDLLENQLICCESTSQISNDKILSCFEVSSSNNHIVQKLRNESSSVNNETLSYKTETKNTCNEDDDIVYLNTEDENSSNNTCPSSSSSQKSIDVNSISDDESELEMTRYGRFKSHDNRVSESFIQKEKYDCSEESEQYFEENVEEEDIEEVDIDDDDEQEETDDVGVDDEQEETDEVGVDEQEDKYEVIEKENVYSQEMSNNDLEFYEESHVKHSAIKDDSEEYCNISSHNMEINEEKFPFNNTNILEKKKTFDYQDEKSADSSIIECENVHEEHSDHQNDKTSNSYIYHQNQTRINDYMNLQLQNKTSGDIELINELKTNTKNHNFDMSHGKTDIDNPTSSDITKNPSNFLFGQQDTSDNKPMLLFGQIYSFQNEQPVAIMKVSESSKSNSFTQIENIQVNNDTVSEKVEVVDEIKDILELESLPDSNPDEFIETYNTRSRSSSIQSENSIIYRDKKSINVVSNCPSTSFKNKFNEVVDSYEDVRVLKKPRRSLRASSADSKINYSNATRSKRAKSISSFSSTIQSSENHRSTTNTKEIPPNNENYQHDTKVSDTNNQYFKSNNALEKSLQNDCSIIENEFLNSDIISCSTRSKSLSNTSLNNYAAIEILNNSNLIKDNTVNKIIPSRTRRAKSLSKIQTVTLPIASTSLIQSTISEVSFSKNLNCQHNLKTSKHGNSDSIVQHALIDEISSMKSVNNEPIRKTRRSVRASSEESYLSVMTPLKRTKSSSYLRSKDQAVDISIINDSVHSKTLEMSPTKNANIQCKLKQPIYPDTPLHDQKESHKSFKSIVSKVDSITSDKIISKNIDSPELATRKTRSKSKSTEEVNQIITDNPSNLFRFSGMVDDNNRQKRISLSKNKIKNQEDLAQPRRKSERSKSLTPGEPIYTKKTAFGLEQIPEEEPCSSEKNILESDYQLVKKSKFNFASSKLKKYSKNIELKVDFPEKKIITPRRSKSVQPSPALTFSTVKEKPKRSCSMNLIISDDKTPNKNDFYPALKKALKSTKKISKKAPEKSLKLKNNETVITECNQDFSDQESIESSDLSESLEKCSPIAAGTPRHMILYTPAKKIKIPMLGLDSDGGDSSTSSNESTDSKRVMTRSMSRNASYIEPEVNDSVIKNSRRLSITDSTIMSSSSNKLKSKLSTADTKKKTYSSDTSDLINSPKINKTRPIKTTDNENKIKTKTKTLKSKVTHVETDPNAENSMLKKRITRSQLSILERDQQITSKNDELLENQVSTVIQMKGNQIFVNFKCIW